ncbi:MAG: ABC transporter permease subunit [Anaerolineae bacterium]|nr:ABC transporter permease subunit [Anaerolineae bacterium]
MRRNPLIFKLPSHEGALFSIGDLVVMLGLAGIVYLGVRLAVATPLVIQGPEISLDPSALPYYALLSTGRMLAAYILSMGFSLVYGYAAARNRRLERIMLPILDILQSVPILSFLPVVLLGLTAIMAEDIAVELAAIVLIFTSQAWNLTFSFYQSMRTIPTEYREAGAIFRLGRFHRFRHVELPFAATGLIWNSVMSWAGGWFFLMAAEIFSVGARDFRLPGLGAYLQTAASQSDTQAMILGLATLILIIIALDQLVWRPLLAWAERFRVSQVGDDAPVTSWFLDSLSRSRIAHGLNRRIFAPAGRWLSRKLVRPPRYVPGLEPAADPPRSRWSLVWKLLLILLIIAGVVGGGMVLLSLPLDEWLQIAAGALATTLRVTIAVLIALAWTIPAGVLIGTNPRAARILQPMVEIAASIPATALFPIMLAWLLLVPAGANAAAILLMLLGTQWYLLFNIIAGASAMPQDLQYTSDLIRLRGWRRWRTLVLPALFPFIITGMITASGGAWNASIVAEYTEFGGEVTQVVGLGSLISTSTARGNYPLLLAATLTMVVLVVLINRLVWRRLFRVAETRYRMDQ